MKSSCLICDRIKQINNHSNNYFVKELETGFVVIGDSQFYSGYTIFLCKVHVRELHDLESDFKQRFLQEMAIVAEAVFKAFTPDKLNYELLGNTDEHLHWHLFPRRRTDPEPKKAVWVIKKEDRSVQPESKTLEELKNKLKIELEKLL